MFFGILRTFCKKKVLLLPYSPGPHDIRKKFIMALVFIFIGAYLLPPITPLISKLLKINFSEWRKIAGFFIFLIGSLFLSLAVSMPPLTTDSPSKNVAKPQERKMEIFRSSSVS